MNFRRIILFALLSTAAPAAEQLPDYKNPQLSIERRADDLLGRMTLEEKVAQLRTEGKTEQIADGAMRFDAEKAAKVLGTGLGGYGPVRIPISEEVALRNAAQKFMIEKTRLGIPLVFHEEGCHGVLAPEANSFPVPIGLACSWDEDLVERTFAAIGAEMRSRGAAQALTPILDICQDPRWGRTDEMLGEDPFLNGRIGIAMVNGLQGRVADRIDGSHVATTLKHLTGHGAPEAGVNRAPAHLGRRELFEAHLVPFEMVLAATKPAAVMPSYNEIDGIPSHANKWLLQDVLRKQFGYEGLITSDYSGVQDLKAFHHVATTEADAALRAFNAGVDMDLPDGVCYAKLGDLVKSGKILTAALDASVRRVLCLKFRLGLFENPFADAAKASSLVKLDTTRALALEAARKSIVLLKNDNALLPLTKGAQKTIAVIGPHSDDTRLGSYSGEPTHRVSVLDGIRRAVGDSGKVIYSKGCSLTTNETASPMNAWLEVDLQVFPTPAEDQAAIADAVEVARNADLVVLVLGENELICRESWAPHHIGDRSSLDLIGAQNQLADAIFALGKPVVVYLMNGRPLAIPKIIERANAVLEGWYAGQETGNAAADILFGQVNPSAKLTITVPRSVGQIPIYYNHKPSSHSFSYLDEVSSPLFPFGFGLSYTKFDCGPVKLSAAAIKRDGHAQARVIVTNSGSTAGDEIVQLYITDRVASVTRPVKSLKGFRRIHLAPGASQQVEFQITPEMLSLYDETMNRVVEPGEFEIIIGNSSAADNLAVLNVTE